MKLAYTLAGEEWSATADQTAKAYHDEMLALADELERMGGNQE